MEQKEKSLPLKFRRLLTDKYARRTTRVRAYRVLHGKPMWTQQPVALQLDTHNYCNLACIYCNPQGIYVSERGYLPMDTIKFVLKYFHDNNIFLNYVKPFLNGEPLLEQRMPRITKLIKKEVGARVDVYTNGTVYQNRHLLHDPNIDEIRFTISAATPETYLKVHGKPLFHEALKTLLWVTNNRYAHQKIYVNYVLCQANWDELSAWKQLFSGYVQNVLALHEGVRQKQSEKAKGIKTFQEALDRASFIGRDLTYSEERPCPCFSTLSISFDGKIMQCADTPYEYNWGNVEEVDLMEVWRKRLDLGLNHPACRKCNFKNPRWKEIFKKYVWT